MTLQDSERKFYQETIASLLQYNGLLISTLTARGQMPPIPSPMSFSIPMPTEEDMKKMEQAWKDSPFGVGLSSASVLNPGDINKMFNDAMKKMMSKTDEDDDKKLT